MELLIIKDGGLDKGLWVMQWQVRSKHIWKNQKKMRPIHTLYSAF
jgi:hypothetical protein